MGADRLIRLLLLAAVALLGACGAETSEPELVRVDSVRDGDTILLTDGARVRLLQVDAPELGIECWGDEAAAELARLAPPGSELRLEADPDLDRIDRHDRLLRYVYAGGLNLNLELVRRGAAAPYFYRGARGRHAVPLLRAGERARLDRRGLWSACPSARLRPTRAIASGPS